jgi:tetratricopeptide (TPR) repeat protein
MEKLWVSALLFSGVLYAGNAEPDRALDLYKRTEYHAAIALLQHANHDAHTLQLLGQCYFMEGQFSKATDSLERAAALAPNDSNIQHWLGRAWGRRAETSFALNAMGYATKTRDAFERAVRLDPENGEAINDLFDFYLEAPSLLGGGIDKARKLLPSIERLDPAEIHFAQARIEEKQKDFDKAESELRRAAEIAPRSVGRVIDLAKFLARRGHYDESDKLFQQAEKLAPNAPKVLYARADSLIDSRRNATQARELLKKYLAANNLTPDDPSRWEAQKLLKKVEGS